MYVGGEVAAKKAKSMAVTDRPRFKGVTKNRAGRSNYTFVQYVCMKITLP